MNFTTEIDIPQNPNPIGYNSKIVLSKIGKPTLSCYISKELVADSKLNVGQVVRELGKYIQGGGGG